MAVPARLFFLVLAGVLAAAGASADTIPDTASKWGLLGTWRVDCSKQASWSDPDLRYVVRGDKLFHDREFGDRRDSNAVLSATITPDNAIELVIRFDMLSQTRQWTYVKQSDGRIQAVSNRNVDNNEYTVRDGKYLANGNATPLQSRCR